MNTELGRYRRFTRETRRTVLAGASRRRGRWERCCGHGGNWGSDERRMEEDRLQRLSGRWRLVKFDENFLAGGRRDEEEIDEGGVSAGSRGGVDGANRELVFEDLGGAIDVTATELDLLNAFAEFSEEAGDCAGAGRVAGGE